MRTAMNSPGKDRDKGPKEKCLRVFEKPFEYLFNMKSQNE